MFVYYQWYFFFYPGIIITSYEQEETLRKAFYLLKTVLPFFNCSTGPSVIMTDNCEELHRALADNWPDSTLLLCTFHILQQVWRWLYDSTHGIGKNDRVVIMNLFRKLVNAENVGVHITARAELFESKTTKKYDNCVKYFEDLCAMSERWAKCFRIDKLIRGSNTNNYC